MDTTSEVRVPIKFIEGAWMYLRVAIIDKAVRFVGSNGDPIDIIVSSKGLVTLLYKGDLMRTLQPYKGAQVVEKVVNGERVEVAEVDGVVYINTTPDAFAYLCADGTVIYVPRGISVRPGSKTEPTSEQIGGVPLLETRFDELVGLPDREDGTNYIGSMPVAQRAAVIGRPDVIGPDSGSSLETGAVRDSKGNPALTRYFTRYAG